MMQIATASHEVASFEASHPRPAPHGASIDIISTLAKIVGAPSASLAHATAAAQQALLAVGGRRGAAREMKLRLLEQRVHARWLMSQRGCGGVTGYCYRYSLLDHFDVSVGGWTVESE
jgi:hypothetical protein